MLNEIEYFSSIEILEKYKLKRKSLWERIKKGYLVPTLIDNEKYFTEKSIKDCFNKYPLKTFKWTTDAVKDLVKTKFPHLKLHENYVYTSALDKFDLECKIHGTISTCVYYLTITEFGCKYCGKTENTKRMMKTKSKTFEEFELMANEKHKNKFKYIKESFVNLSSKMKAICPIHGEIEIYPNHHLNGTDCAKCAQTILVNKMNKNKKLSQEDFIKRSNDVHKGFYDYSKTVFKKAVGRVTVICPEHGEFIQISSHHMRGVGCPKCAIKRLSKAQTLTRDEFLQKCFKTHGNKYDYSKFIYTGCDNKSIVICPIHGEISMTPDEHIYNFGCPECGKISSQGAQRKTKEEFISDAIKVHGNKYDYSKVVYKSCDTKITIICNKHKKEFSQTPYSHLQGQGCPRCYGRISSKEERWLDYINIPNTNKNRQVTFTLKSGRRISVDGYNPETNTVYLFNGDYFHGNPKVYKHDRINVRCGKSYKELYERTIMIENEIKDNGFNLVVMWESDFKIIDKIIKKKLIDGDQSTIS